jgi:hypothetical protein
LKQATAGGASADSYAHMHYELLLLHCGHFHKLEVARSKMKAGRNQEKLTA